MSEPEDLLNDAVFSVRVGPTPQRKSLPGVLAALCDDLPVEPTALQPHQQHAWHAFTVQLGALARRRGGLSGLATSERAWRDALLSLSGGAGEAWHMRVADLAKPAFFQPPIPEGKLDEKRWSVLPTPDALDILVTAKNHDVKQTVIRSARVEHWVYALINLQTMQGFLGAGNYGIARMNGGFGNRPSLSASRSLSWNDRFRRDLEVWLARRDTLIEQFGYADDGVALVWLAPWDGTTSLASTSLDPFFIETCRRVRLMPGPGANPHDPSSLVARMLPTRTARLDFASGGGSTGDIWTPVERKRNVALSLAGGGFDYAKLSELLFSGDWERPAALSGDEDAVTQVQAWALVRGQGKTEGLHQRFLTLGRTMRRLFARGDPEQQLAQRSQEWIQDAATVRLKVLRPALLALAQGGAESLDFQDKRVDPLTSRFDDDVDSAFFAMLFASFEAADERDPRDVWRYHLWTLAQRHFGGAVSSLPYPSERRWRALARAESILRGAARKHIPEAFANQDDTTGETDDSQPST